MGPKNPNGFLRQTSHTFIRQSLWLKNQKSFLSGLNSLAFSQKHNLGRRDLFMSVQSNQCRVIAMFLFLRMISKIQSLRDCDSKSNQLRANTLYQKY